MGTHMHTLEMLFLSPNNSWNTHRMVRIIANNSFCNTFGFICHKIELWATSIGKPKTMYPYNNVIGIVTDFN